jgi:glycine C-acetyltransferase/8-amino-7-oxononanoate synthase
VTDIAETLARLRHSGLFRELRTVEGPQGARVRVDGMDVLLMCSNDYLGLAGHPSVRAAAAEAALEWGAGAGASRLVSGNMTLHRRLEAELATFKGSESCVLFGSGFLANAGILPALAGRGDVILSDALNHASIVDGCRLARAETVVYPHADLEALEAGLRRCRDRQAVIVTDAVFSMEGDLAPLADIVRLARQHGARVVVDEAHATGVVGPGGRGLVAELGLEREIDVVVGTLGKALGSYGAFASCDAETASFLVNRARTLIYSTALPPPAVAAAREALRLLREQPTRVERLQANGRALREELARCGFAVEPGSMPIVPVVVGEPEAAMSLCNEALRRGVFAQAIRPPTVPEGTSRLRVVATAGHDEAEVRGAARTIAAAAAAEARA